MKYNITGLQTVSQKCLANLIMSILVFVLLYADDTILLAESKSDLQNFWNIFEDGNWKSMLKKRKYWFSKHKRSYDYEFKLYGVNIGIGNSYSYFCLLFNYNDNFTIAGKKLFEQAQNAVYGKLRNISIPTNL